MLVEDQALIRMGIEMSLSSESDIEIVSNLENGLLAVQAYPQTRPDVVLMDIRMPIMGGVEAARKIKQLDRNAKIIFLTSNDSIEDVFSAFAVGGSGYCLKDIEPEKLIESLKTACDGGLAIDARIAGKMLHFIATIEALPKSVSDDIKLNPRDQEVLHQLASGLKSEQMTVHTKLSVINILNKIILLQEVPPGRALDVSDLALTVSSKFELLEELGAGAMGQVFKARRKQSGELVAIKILHSHDKDSWQRLIREASIMTQLSHPGIIRIHDLLVDSDRIAYLVMELVDGPNLSDVLDCGGAMIEKEALQIFVQCTSALDYLHVNGIVHRDIKPSNIILYSENEESIYSKLADFGISKQNNDMQRLTRRGEVFGSPLYMSPEQCRGEELDARSDIYSFGCVMFELLNGFPPFVGNNSFETMSMHVKYPPPDSHEWTRQNVTPNLKSIVKKCLSKSPNDRFQSSKDLLKALDSVEFDRGRTLNELFAIDSLNS
jgi:Serine/threonine protein kinase